MHGREEKHTRGFGGFLWNRNEPSHSTKCSTFIDMMNSGIPVRTLPHGVSKWSGSMKTDLQVWCGSYVTCLPRTEVILMLNKSRFSMSHSTTRYVSDIQINTSLDCTLTHWLNTYFWQTYIIVSVRWGRRTEQIKTMPFLRDQTLW
jgi:hypothetical protein